MLGIKKLDIFVIKSFIMLFIGTSFICLFIFMMQFLWRNVDELVGKGLDIVVLGKFFYYSALSLWPTSAPLAVLLASLITFGNFGERFELLAMKAAGIPLTKVMRPLVIFITFVAALSFYFQNVTGPNSLAKLYTLLYSIKQKSPEVDIPEGSFYQLGEGSHQGVSYNLYIKKKNKETGMLYNIMIYNFSDGFENAHIIVADSGKLETTADKQHIYLHLYNGEQFENLRQQSSRSDNVPYRRESFSQKHTLIEFNSNFDMQDGSFYTNQAPSKNMLEIAASIDSMTHRYDSIGRVYYKEAMTRTLRVVDLSPSDSTWMKESQLVRLNLDSLLAVSSSATQAKVMKDARQKAESAYNDIHIKSYTMKDGNNSIRRHEAEWNKKITLSLACIIFFFIGAPLGAIIRKGGLGMPVVISVIIFIIYFVINSMGERAAKNGNWEMWFGTWISTMVTAPVGAFFTYKANKDSAVFNADAYMAFVRKTFGIRIRRHYFKKEVIIEDPDYSRVYTELDEICQTCEHYQHTHSLHKAPNYLRLFAHTEKDTQISELNERLEEFLDKLANSKYSKILLEMENYPVLMTDAHKSPFTNRWLNLLAGILLPVGLVLYFRVWMFGKRLDTDLSLIVSTSRHIQQEIESTNLK